MIHLDCVENPLGGMLHGLCMAIRKFSQGEITRFLGLGMTDWTGPRCDCCFIRTRGGCWWAMILRARCR